MGLKEDAADLLRRAAEKVETLDKNDVKAAADKLQDALKNPTGSSWCKTGSTGSVFAGVDDDDDDERWCDRCMSKEIVGDEEDELCDVCRAEEAAEEAAEESTVKRATIVVTAQNVTGHLSATQVEAITNDMLAALRVVFGSVTLVSRAGDYDNPTATVVLDLDEPRNVPGMTAEMSFNMIAAGIGAGHVTGVGPVSAVITFA